MERTAERPATEPARIAAFVLEDLPVAGRSGYCTYNRAFVQALVTAGWEVHLVVIGPRLPAPLFDPATLLGLPSVHFHICGARYFLGRFWVSEPRAAARAWFQLLSSRLPRRLGAWLAARRRAGSVAAGAALIGRMSDSRDARRVAPVLDRIRPGVLLVDTIFRAPAVSGAGGPFARVLVAHDVFFKRCASLVAAGLAPLPFVTAESERALLAGFTRIVAISDSDALELRSLAPRTPVTTLRSPIEAARANAALPGGPTHILYLGSAAHHNVEGLRWFLAEIWPTIAAECPELVLDVVGSIGATLGDAPAGVRTHGELADIGTVACLASFAINPVRAGSGLKIKMLDYFAHGLPCITTSVGKEGFPDSPDYPIAVSDSAAEFARRVIGWSRDRTGIVHLRSAAHRYVTQFSLSSFRRELTATLQAPSD